MSGKALSAIAFRQDSGINNKVSLVYYFNNDRKELIRSEKLT